MDRRTFNKTLSLAAAGLIFPAVRVRAKTYLTVEQARQILWGTSEMEAVAVALSREQVKAIQSASRTRVRNKELQAWKTVDQGWFIVDQVIGKHENIDIAFALSAEGKLKGMEILTYRETYGFEINNPRWRAQFHGKDFKRILKLDRDIKNIAGATLSCRHVTEGVNRLTHTWNLVLRHL